ncbi:hypothetical protein HHI36_002509 [Cryptolaemus montrouzieri]|uniref:U3 small nucleolar ribonucleoprotein protein MPP10 n=1 Tax=Cryptolaemus montrouzieri TaxID=559131 RepID=A0ABD2PAV8_9CUCU
MDYTTIQALEDSYTYMVNLSRAPEQLFQTNENLSSQIKCNLKNIYDYSKKQEIKLTKSSTLPELIIHNFDNEQIWQQIELQNECILENAISRVGSLLSKKGNLRFHGLVNQRNKEGKNESLLVDEHGETLEEIEKECQELDSESEEDEDENQDSSELEEMEVEESSEQKNENLGLKSSKKLGRNSIVDDEFFKLHEMEEFLNSEEKKVNDSGNEQDMEDTDESEESVDLFAEDSEDSEDGKVRLAKYKEFFVSKEEEKKPKRNKFLEEFPDDDNDDMENQLSTLELRQNRLKQKIDEIENKAISEKPWQLQGEIKGDSRPQNSLLEEIVEFDRTTRPAPIITGQTTLQLEDIIKQRIKDKVFDSVVRKVKPVETPLEYKKKLVLDQEKSKASLAQIYEKEYLEQQAALDPDNADKEEEEPEIHKEIKSIMKTLFHQLDSLSNFHYTPKPAIPELKIISNLPAINIEEVAPVAASDAALLAPEEIKSKPKADILGESERNSTDKKRERRKKKLKQRFHAKEKREKLLQATNSGRENKNSKEKSKKLLDRLSKESNVEKVDESLGRKGIKSSTAFFTQLQEQVRSQINLKGEPKKKKRIVHDANKMKL